MSIEYVVLKKNNTIKFTVHEFDRMTEIQRNLYKGKICCPKCNKDAGYRKASVDGKVACFFAYHLPECQMASSSDNEKTENVEETNIIEIDTSIYGIRWNYKLTKESGTDIPTSRDNERIPSEGLSYNKNPSKTIIPKLTLNQILTYAEIGKLDDVCIEMNLGGIIKDLSEIVFHVTKIDDTLVGKTAFFFGEMKYYKERFINLRNVDKVSILIIDEVINGFKERYSKKFFEVVKDNHMIIYGKIIKTKNGKYLIIMDNCNKLYFRKK
ncbi:MAG: hypothetical protein JXM74_06905 [Fusobacteriaceae bacterium]|nr:hypothetical protein [Fusobacteriaceae bacterium]MBN2838471.1 hypothetical protein [Fusobacteriaceae bacterium]